MNQKHVYYFDRIRLMAALSVIFMHVAAGPLRKDINPEWHVINLLTCFAFTAVPLFLMMSGYLILNSEKTADVSFLFRKRLPRLLIPLIGWTVVAILWRMVNSRDYSITRFVNDLLASLQKPAWVHLWYMYSLIVLYILSPFLYSALQGLSKKGHILVFTIICILSVRTMISQLAPQNLKQYMQISLLSDLNFLNGILPLFLLGYYLGNYEKKIPNSILLAGIFTLLLTIVAGTYKLTIRDGSYNQSFQNQYSGFEVLLAALVFLLFKQNFNKPSKLLQAIPIIPLALPIYLMHNILLSMMGYFITVNTLWDTVYVTAINFIICFVTMKTVATIKPICYLATGITYRDACKTCNWVYTFQKIKNRSISKK